MEKYGNRNGNSSVLSYEIGTDYIRVGFSSGCIYEYTYSSAGTGEVELMKSYAMNGKGLNNFIKKYGQDNYSKKM